MLLRVITDPESVTECRVGGFSQDVGARSSHGAWHSYSNTLIDPYEQFILASRFKRMFSKRKLDKPAEAHANLGRECKTISGLNWELWTCDVVQPFTAMLPVYTVNYYSCS